MGIVFQILKTIGKVHIPMTGGAKRAIHLGKLSTLSGSFVKTKREAEIIRLVILDLKDHSHDFLVGFYRILRHSKSRSEIVGRVENLARELATAFASPYQDRMFILNGKLISAQGLATEYFVDSMREFQDNNYELPQDLIVGIA